MASESHNMVCVRVSGSACGACVRLLVCVGVCVYGHTHRYVGVKSIQHSLASTCPLNGLTMFARNRNKKENNNTNQKRCKERDLISSYGICSCTCHIIFPKQIFTSSITPNMYCEGKGSTEYANKTIRRIYRSQRLYSGTGKYESIFHGFCIHFGHFFYCCFVLSSSLSSLSLSRCEHFSIVANCLCAFFCSPITHSRHHHHRHAGFILFYFIMIGLDSRQIHKSLFIFLKSHRHFTQFIFFDAKRKTEKKKQFDAHDMHCECEN